MFNINFTYLINLLLPPVLRTEKQTAWLEVITYFLKVIYENFMSFRINKLYDINFTGQVMYLEKKLQTVFNNNGIYIADALFLEDIYFTNIQEGEFPVYISNIAENEETVYLHNISELSVGVDVDFYVYVPYVLYSSMDIYDFAKMNKIINYYKLVDKQYLIKSYNE